MVLVVCSTSIRRDGARIVVNYQSDKKSAAVVATILPRPSLSKLMLPSQLMWRLFAEAKRRLDVSIVVANSGIIDQWQQQVMKNLIESLLPI